VRRGRGAGRAAGCAAAGAAGAGCEEQLGAQLGRSWGCAAGGVQLGAQLGLRAEVERWLATAALPAAAARAGTAAQRFCRTAPQAPAPPDPAPAPRPLRRRRFYNGTDGERNNVFKLIPHIAQGSWLIQQSVGTTPVMLGKKILTVYHRTDRYIEVCCGCLGAAEGLLRGCWGAAGGLLGGCWGLVCGAMMG
jgi:hypothetical protein